MTGTVCVGGGSESARVFVMFVGRRRGGTKGCAAQAGRHPHVALAVPVSLSSLATRGIFGTKSRTAAGAPGPGGGASTSVSTPVSPSAGPSPDTPAAPDASAVGASMFFATACAATPHPTPGAPPRFRFPLGQSLPTAGPPRRAKTRVGWVMVIAAPAGDPQGVRCALASHWRSVLVVVCAGTPCPRAG